MRASIRTVFCCIFLFSLPVLAHDLTENQAERAKYLETIIRCPVCSGQVLAGSEASIAIDMKKLIRAKIKSGSSNEEIIIYFRNIYGDDIAQIPPKNEQTFLLWYGPYILMFGLVAFFILRKFRAP
ncbi:MAG: cytochrome c-type biogenesis protein [Pseudomonadota bacterium]